MAHYFRNLEDLSRSLTSSAVFQLTQKDLLIAHLRERIAAQQKTITASEAALHETRLSSHIPQKAHTTRASQSAVGAEVQKSNEAPSIFSPDWNSDDSGISVNINPHKSAKSSKSQTTPSFVPGDQTHKRIPLRPSTGRMSLLSSSTEGPQRILPDKTFKTPDPKSIRRMPLPGGTFDQIRHPTRSSMLSNQGQYSNDHERGSCSTTSIIAQSASRGAMVARDLNISQGRPQQFSNSTSIRASRPNLYTAQRRPMTSEYFAGSTANRQAIPTFGMNPHQRARVGRRRSTSAMNPARVGLQARPSVGPPGIGGDAQLDVPTRQGLGRFAYRPGPKDGRPSYSTL